MGDQLSTGVGSAACQHVEHARWQASLQRQLTQSQPRQWGLFRNLDPLPRQQHACSMYRYTFPRYIPNITLNINSLYIPHLGVDWQESHASSSDLSEEVILQGHMHLNMNWSIADASQTELHQADASCCVAKAAAVEAAEAAQGRGAPATSVPSA